MDLFLSSTFSSQELTFEHLQLQLHDVSWLDARLAPLLLYDELVGPLEVVPEAGGLTLDQGEAEAAHLTPGSLARLSLGEEIPDRAGARAGARHHRARALHTSHNEQKILKIYFSVYL